MLARLDRRRQRLTPDARGTELANCPSADGLHAQALFLRAATDMLLLNSACSEPILVAGAWQFYDGPLFHWMLHEAAGRAAGGRELVNDDPMLYRSIPILIPISIPTHIHMHIHTYTYTYTFTYTEALQARTAHAWPRASRRHGNQAHWRTRDMCVAIGPATIRSAGGGDPTHTHTHTHRSI